MTVYFDNDKQMSYVDTASGRLYLTANYANGVAHCQYEINGETGMYGIPMSATDVLSELYLFLFPVVCDGEHLNLQIL